MESLLYIYLFQMAWIFCAAGDFRVGSHSCHKVDYQLSGCQSKKKYLL